MTLLYVVLYLEARDVTKGLTPKVRALNMVREIWECE